MRAEHRSRFVRRGRPHEVPDLRASAGHSVGQFAARAVRAAEREADFIAAHAAFRGTAAAAEENLAATESALARDNAVLRGIIERQNSEGEERSAELRRQRLTLRIIYARPDRPRRPRH